MKIKEYWRFTVVVMFISISYPAFSQFEQNALSQAVDNTKLEFTTEAPGFFGQRIEVNFDGDAAQSGGIGSDGVSVVAAEVDFLTPTRVTFDWKVSSEEDFDILVFLVLDPNGNSRNIQDSISGEVAWTSRSYIVPAGQHILAWGYTKDDSVSQGQDAGWLDNVRVGTTGGELSESIKVAPLASVGAIVSFILSEDIPVEPLDETDIYPPITPLTEAGPHLKLESTPGDYIGQGFSYEYTQRNANFNVSTNFDNGITVSLDGYSGVNSNSTENWTLNFSDGGDQLTVGKYRNASRFPFNNSNENGLSFSGTGRGCNQLGGEYTIYDIEYLGNDLVKLTADFVQRCENSDTPLSGSIRFDASLPDPSFPSLPETTGSPTPTPPSLVGSGTVIEVEGSAGDYITAGSNLSFDDTNATITAQATSQNKGIAFSINEIGGRSYSLEFRASQLAINNSNGMLLTTGVYNNALRSAFAAPQPGLSFSGNGRGCNTSVGTFSIYEIQFDPSNEITKLLADFEQLCDSSSSPLRGSINYVR